MLVNVVEPILVFSLFEIQVTYRPSIVLYFLGAFFELWKKYKTLLTYYWSKFRISLQDKCSKKNGHIKAVGNLH